MLRVLGSVLQNSDLSPPDQKVLKEIIVWLTREINYRTGVSQSDLIDLTVRVPWGRSLDGESPSPLHAAFGCEPLHDLNHVAAPLHELDRDGTTVRLWRELGHRWPEYGEAYRSLFSSEAKTTSNAPADKELRAKTAGKPAQKATVMPAAASRTKPHPDVSEQLPGPKPYPTTVENHEQLAESIAAKLGHLLGTVRHPTGQITLPWETEPEWEAVSPMVRRLVKFMCMRQQADLADLCPAVWEKNPADLGASALPNAITKANKFLAKQQWPMLEKVRGAETVRWLSRPPSLSNNSPPGE